MASKIEEGARNKQSSFFDEEWSEHGGADPFDDLKPIMEFNASYNGEHGSSSDSQLTSTSIHLAKALDAPPPAPPEDTEVYQTKFSPVSSVEQMSDVDPADNFDDFACPSGTPIPIDYSPEAYQDMDFDQAVWSPFGHIPNPALFPPLQETETSPYLYPCIELAHNAMPPQSPPPLLQVQHLYQRRSVSAPPADPFPIQSFYPHHQHPYFLRDGRSSQHLRQPIPMMQPLPQELVRLKPMSKSQRQIANHTHPVQKRDVPKTRRKRQALKQARTQRSQGPTSTPASPTGPQHSDEMDDQSMMHGYAPHSPHMSPLQHVSTRICTPMPSPRREISPMLSDKASMGSPKASSLSIRVSVEHLQAMITEAVHKAVKELRSEDGVT